MKSILALTSLLSLNFLSAHLQASEREFAFSYEATTSPAGSIELESRVLWESGAGFDSFAIRPELEFGITDRLQLGLYLFDVEHTREDGARDTKWTGSGLEVIYGLTNPSADWIGSAIYGEAMINDDAFKLEGKLLLQKNWGPVTLVWNGIVEAEWEDGYSEKVGVLEQTLGLNYHLNASFALGLEAKHEVEFENWSESGGNAIFVGPNVSWKKGNFFTAASCLFRVSDVPGEPHVELGVILGYNF